MIALLKYGAGTPFYRLAGLQNSLGVPLPPSTQWGVVKSAAELVEPAFDELYRHAAQGEVFHNDDTTMRILDRIAELRNRDADPAKKGGRTGTFTSGIVSIVEGRKIALFFTGDKHAGENLEKLLSKRSKELKDPIQMCDSLSRNLPKKLKTIVANCIAHSRRRFADVAVSFPDQVLHVLTELGKVYENDATAKKEKMSPDERLRFHQAKSGPVLAQLRKWFMTQFQEKLIEPNSGLGDAIAYMRKHWKKLVRFLLVAGAPLDNNICERALKKAILHRKNSLFYKTDKGAHVGDMFMSLIYTAQFSGKNPMDYLTELQRHADAVSKDPKQWMPWNYEESVARCASMDI